MKRHKITLAQVAEYKNLSKALYKAAKGKRYRDDVHLFMRDMEVNLNRLAIDIINQRLPYGHFRAFYINDPKRRLIHAACFEDRIFHHALMNIAGEIIERAMLPSSYACRPHMGVHKAVLKVQQHLRQYHYYVKVDISGYFASINPVLLKQLLSDKFKGREITDQLHRVIDRYAGEQQKGLPIGSLTSQYFANYYLDGLDRLLASIPTVRAHVRYMDDIIWWCDDKNEILQTLQRVKTYLQNERDLVLKNNIQIQPSKQGVSYCGFRILAGAIRLSRRRKKRFQSRRQYWESKYQQGVIDGTALQQAYAAVQAITVQTDSLAWRQKNLQLHPCLDV